MPHNRRRLMLLRTEAAILVCAVLITAAAMCWWLVFDPVAPDIVVESSGLEERMPEPGTRQNARIINAWRWVRVSHTKKATLSGQFEREDTARLQNTDQGNLFPARSVFPLASVETVFEKGRYRRAREWEMPLDTIPGRWTYRSNLRFCNPVRCKDVVLPPITIELKPLAP